MADDEQARTWREAVIAEALTWAGTPYRHQASLKGVGCDCLGLVRGVWRALYGEEPEAAPPYSGDWAEASGEETLLDAAGRHMRSIAIGNALPGDLLIFRWRPHLPAKHCGILVGPDRMIHAYDAAGEVTISNVASSWTARIATAFALPVRL